MTSSRPLLGGTVHGDVRKAGSQESYEGWKPVGTEAIISANPDFILITQRGMGSFSDVKALSEHPSLKFSNAAKKGNIIAKDGMAMLGFGPRTIKIASDLAKRFSLDEL